MEDKKLFESPQRAIITPVKSETIRNVKVIDLLPQFLASSLMYLCVIQAGVSMSISSVLISQLADGNEILINTNQSSIIGSIFSIALPFGAIFSGFLSDKFGRKKIGLYVCIPFFIAWVLIGISGSVMTIYVSRIIAGICCGVTTACVVYTAEISYKTIRSALLCMNSVWVSFGIFLTYLLNYFHLNWHLIGWIYAAVSLLSMLLILFVPESTHWILFFNHRASEEQKLLQLKKSLSRLYRDPAVS
jgi:MFS family permease